MSGASIRIYDVGDGRLHLRWFCRNSGLWHEILDSFKSRFATHHDRSYSPRTRTWSVPARHSTRLAEWADYWFDEQDQEWLDEEWAEEQSQSRTYSRGGHGQYSRQDTSASRVEGAYSLLCLTRNAPPELVRVVHHWWVRALHPDTGHGDTARMASINAAVDMIGQDSEREAS